MTSVAPSRMDDEDRGAYIGWLAGGLVIVAVLAVGAGLWFHYHP
jgi:hypothetical protein